MMLHQAIGECEYILGREYLYSSTHWDIRLVGSVGSFVCNHYNDLVTDGQQLIARNSNRPQYMRYHIKQSLTLAELDRVGLPDIDLAVVRHVYELDYSRGLCQHLVETL